MIRSGIVLDHESNSLFLALAVLVLSPAASDLQAVNSQAASAKELATLFAEKFWLATQRRIVGTGSLIGIDVNRPGGRIHVKTVLAGGADAVGLLRIGVQRVSRLSAGGLWIYLQGKNVSVDHRWIS